MFGKKVRLDAVSTGMQSRQTATVMIMETAVVQVKRTVEKGVLETKEIRTHLNLTQQRHALQIG